MKFLILIIAVFSARAAAETYFDKPVPFVLGGVESQWGQFASSVIIDGPNEFCGGSLVDGSHVLTAASCLLNENYEIINPIWFKIIAGDIFFSPASYRRVERNVSRIFVHPEFNAFTGENDIAVIRLNQPEPFPHNTVEWALRQTRIVRNGAACQLVAFGRTSNVTATWRARQVALALNILDRDNCAGVTFIHVNRIAERLMCAQTSANAAPCAGNLGSGLYCDGLLTGVLTGGIGCNATPAVFQQVRAYNRWIEEQFLRSDLPRESGTIPFDTQGLPVHVQRNN